MKQEMLRFSRGVVGMAILSGGVAWSLFRWVPGLEAAPGIAWLFPFFLLFTLLFHYLLLKASSRRPQLFVTYFMGGTTLKMFLVLGIILLYGFFFREHLPVFALTFFGLYLVFTAYEVVAILRYLRE